MRLRERTPKARDMVSGGIVAYRAPIDTFTVTTSEMGGDPDWVVLVPTVIGVQTFTVRTRNEYGAIGRVVRRIQAGELDRVWRPWQFTDPPAIAWDFDPFPKATAALEALRERLLDGRRQIADWIDPEREDYW